MKGVTIEKFINNSLPSKIMELTELIVRKGKLVGSEGKPVTAEPVGEPVFVKVAQNGFPSFSDRVRRYTQAQAPERANAYCIGRNGIKTEVLEKARDYMRTGRWKIEKVIAQPVQFYII